MLKKCMFVFGMIGCLALGFVSVGNADERLPAPNVVGLSESEARGVLAVAGYESTVISKNGGGPDCVVFNQVNVTDRKDLSDPDDDESQVYLSVNCLQ